MTNRTALAVAFYLCGLTAVISPACSGEDNRPPVATNNGKGGESSSIGGMGGDLLVPVNNCGDQACEGEGATCVTIDATPTCKCATGYLSEEIDNGYKCVVDKSCVKLRYLESGCRVELNGAPAVGLFFGADYCAGTAVLPEDIGDLSKAFHIQEDDKDLTVEAGSTVLSRDVESFVGVVLDVSRSVQQNKSLVTQLTTELQAFVDQLQPAPGKPPVMVSLMVFAQQYGVLVPFTSDVALVKSKLAALEADPMATITPVLKNYTGEARIVTVRPSGRLSARAFRTLKTYKSSAIL
jgi:hypothetical protein